jgi:hypothetical protein
MFLGPSHITFTPIVGTVKNTINFTPGPIDLSLFPFNPCNVSASNWCIQRATGPQEASAQAQHRVRHSHTSYLLHISSVKLTVHVTTSERSWPSVQLIIKILGLGVGDHHVHARAPPRVRGDGGRSTASSSLVPGLTSPPTSTTHHPHTSLAHVSNN